MRSFIILSLLLLLVTGCNKRTTIINQLGERDANEIVVLLASRNIPAEKIPSAVTTTGGAAKAAAWDITVPASQITESLAILNQSGLPRAQGSNLLDLFANQGFGIPSDLQDRIRFQEGLSSQLANTIRMMDGILDATVQITLPRQGEEVNPDQPLTASVYIRHRGVLDNPNSTLVNKIKRLVASSLPGLTPDNVSVVSDRVGFGDMPFRDEERLFQGETLVSIWGITLAARSAMLFRIIFYTFILLLFVACSFIIWMGWKLYPLLEKHGIKSLFTLEPYKPLPETIETPKEEG